MSQTTQTVSGIVLIALQSTLTIVLAILIVVSAVGSCLHKRKPLQKQRVSDLDDDMIPLDTTTYENGSKIATKNGYMATPTNDQSNTFEYGRRASALYRDPYQHSNPGPPLAYEEYSSAYRDDRRTSLATKQANLGRSGSISHDSSFYYRPIGSPPPILK